MVMKSLMMWCPVCEEYTMHAECHRCGAKTVSPHPARFSPQDRWGKYRRMLIRDGCE